MSQNFLWNFLEFSAFIIVAFIVAGIVSALAFFRPYNQPLITFVIHSFVYFFRPKLYVWKKNIGLVKKTRTKIIPQKTKTATAKKISSEKIEAISKTLDFNKLQ